MRKVGFVGLDKYKLLKCGVTEEQAYNFCRKLMINELKYGEYEFVSGGCKKKGIDIICERIADELGLKKIIIMPEVEQWEDKTGVIRHSCTGYGSFSKYDAICLPTGEYELYGYWMGELRCPLYKCSSCGLEGMSGGIGKFSLEQPFYETSLKGYKSRNIEIADTVDKLYCVVVQTKGNYCYHHRGKDVGNTHMANGGCYTMRVAKEKGKEVYLVFVK